MTRILMAGLLALATSLAYVGVASAHTSLSTFEKGDPDVYQPVAMTRAIPRPEAPKSDSLDLGSAKQSSPSGSAMTSLAQFERGDPDV